MFSELWSEDHRGENVVAADDAANAAPVQLGACAHRPPVLRSFIPGRRNGHAVNDISRLKISRGRKQNAFKERADSLNSLGRLLDSTECERVASQVFGEAASTKAPTRATVKVVIGDNAKHVAKNVQPQFDRLVDRGVCSHIVVYVEKFHGFHNMDTYQKANCIVSICDQLVAICTSFCLCAQFG